MKAPLVSNGYNNINNDSNDPFVIMIPVIKWKCLEKWISVAVGGSRLVKKIRKNLDRVSQGVEKSKIFLI